MIRAARAGDVDAVLALWAEARSAHALTDDTPESLLRLMAHDEGALLVAEVDGVVAGALIAGWDGWRGDMYRLAVRPDHRRRGIGLALVRAGEDRLRRLGAPRITALVAHEDDVARAFWTAAGYTIDPNMGRFVRTLPA